MACCALAAFPPGVGSFSNIAKKSDKVQSAALQGQVLFGVFWCSIKKEAKNDNNQHCHQMLVLRVLSNVAKKLKQAVASGVQAKQFKK